MKQRKINKTNNQFYEKTDKPLARPTKKREHTNCYYQK